MLKQPSANPTAEFSELLGLSEGEAKRMITGSNRKYRISRRDGIPYILTRDYKVGRVNLGIEKGKVVAAYKG